MSIKYYAVRYTSNRKQRKFNTRFMGKMPTTCYWVSSNL